jgi:hypothetical protein
VTPAQIDAKAQRSIVVHTAAKDIRVILDEAREAYGPEAFDEDSAQDTILELVTEEVES